MAAFGQLGPGIAHEAKNPLTGILACSQLAAEEADEGSQVQQDLRLIEKEARRCKVIIDNLLKFARQGKAEMKPIDVNAAVEDAIAIVNHQMEINQVRAAPRAALSDPRRSRHGRRSRSGTHSRNAFDR